MFFVWPFGFCISALLVGFHFTCWREGTQICMNVSRCWFQRKASLRIQYNDCRYCTQERIWSEPTERRIGHIVLHIHAHVLRFMFEILELYMLPLPFWNEFGCGFLLAPTLPAPLKGRVFSFRGWHFKPLYTMPWKGSVLLAEIWPIVWWPSYWQLRTNEHLTGCFKMGRRFSSELKSEG